MKKTPCAAPRTRSRFRRFAFHFARWTILVAICVLIRAKHAEDRQQRATREWQVVDVARIRSYLPSAQSIADQVSARNGRNVLDVHGTRVGELLLTSPRADRIVGYAGPTNVLIVLDRNDRIRGIEIVSSRDTREHVEQVEQNRPFALQFRGRSADRLDGLDGVTGATLTSLAIIESVRYRLAGTRRSLRFPQYIALHEIQDVLPEAEALRRRSTNPVEVVDLLDRKGRVVGNAVRGSPATDRIVGYQGPADVLLVFDRKGMLVRFLLRKSFDNQPYVRYVAEDELFADIFRGMTREQLAGFDLEAAEVEGVSGATMTSMAVARAMVEAAREAVAAQRVERSSRGPHWTSNDVGTLVVVLLASLMAWTRVGRKRRVRQAFWIGLVGYFGFQNGDMLSQALLAGWIQHGVPGRLAPGLLLLAAAAFLLPAWGRGPWYCHHVCPFGAAQMLLRHRLPWRWRLPRRVDRTLRLLPAGLLLLVLVVLMTGRSWNLASIEPFHAFLWRFAGWSSLTIAAVGLVWSLFQPMAYCRYGCPTGALLEYGRWTRHGDRFRVADGIALALLGVALVVRWS